MGSVPFHRPLTGVEGLRHKEHAENFPVALRVLPRQLRADLRAVYGVARIIDDLGDQAAGDRVALLEEFRADLATVWQDGRPRHPTLCRLVPTVRARSLEHEPFDRLVRANLQDQQVTSYRTYADLLAYCSLSADPVGRIVLAVFAVRSTEAERLADQLCTGLQLVEHWQDVAEDRRAGRVYLPREDLEAFGVGDADLDSPVSTAAVRRLIAFETGRALDLLTSGGALLTLLRGWARVAVAGYLAGGLGAVDALRRCDMAVLAATPRTKRGDVLRHLSWLLVRPRTHLRRVSSAFRAGDATW
ncbi:MAG: squalene synthase HpnC [Sciscionella sp.]